MSEVRLSVEPRTEFGKGAARRTRRAGKIPAVLYGHGSDPRHLSLPAIEFARVVRENGTNAVITLDVDSSSNATELALTKTIVVHPLKNYIEHVDLLVVKRGEKVTVDVPVVITGDAAPGTLVSQDVDTLTVEVEALHIPEQVEVSVEGLQAGTQILAAQVALPTGAELVTDGEYLVVAVNEAPNEAAMESQVDADGAGVVEDQPESTEE
ncbi:50S ribosomal protein L25/general stress protein Ctc [Amycolatopsis sp. YIM 10]|uniref:50S ribosomal protein L25/general stress protein Ctc n=1 Tax=Amycolatopsis sp. YIM 10 TaxID=2653857 RepID=UPI00128FFD2F|nr:50S ribosomal protein L25/general stress protein Ctc [Amycolatopsis sp. YIM 10]QFU86162.1 50S ribosomal protein L25 [Amycolatopsis sp. YIM 10]